MKHGFTRLAVGVPRVTLADCQRNLEEITSLIDQAHVAEVDILTLPKLALTGYTCGDLFLQSTLLDSAEATLKSLIHYTRDRRPLVAVGLPIKVGFQTIPAVAFVSRGQLLGVMPHTAFTSPVEISLAGQVVPFGTDLLFQCETYLPLTVSLTSGNATIILQPEAEIELVGSAALRRQRLSVQSADTPSVIVYAGAGMGESSTDATFAGHGLIAENGKVLLETECFLSESSFSFCDVDLELVQSERLRRQPSHDSENPSRCISFALSDTTRPLKRIISTIPFLPDGVQDTHLAEIFSIQTAALRRRFEAANSKTAVIGISGGLDSTLALLVTVGAFDCMGKSRSDILGITMPGFGTTDQTHQNAIRLMTALGISQREIPIAKSVLQHFADIGHDPHIHDITYENAQARERTQILMDLANKENGLVIGTGNLSEAALGWSTYGGDHLSMYAVNYGVPKTVVRLMAAFLAKSGTFPDAVADILQDIANTPISPELLPPDADGKVGQRTEDIVGPYILHDFFLYYVVRHGFSPAKIARLAEAAFHDQFDLPTIRKWLTVFYRRFFTQQFKRSCMPDGPQVGPISLSPRGGWQMPSDALATAWLKELEDFR